MRILNISFKNINALAGEGQVDFDRGAIADSGVFAITGPNGAGKTSILDIITLGLYGETYRFNKPAEHIITQHANHSLAQVEFAFNGQNYRSSWQVERDDANHPRMQLSLLESGETQILADTPNQVRSYMQQLTGLDFHKFCKSIVLPQGDSTAFLNALDSERLDILEKISGGDIYEQYQQQIQQRYQQLSDHIAQLEAEIELIPLLTDAELEATDQDLLDYQELSTELKQEQQQIQQQIFRKQHIGELQAQQQQLLDQHAQLQNQHAALQSDLQRITVAPSADIFQDHLRLLDNLQAELALNRTHLHNFTNELKQLQQQLPDFSSASAELNGKEFGSQKQLINAIKLKLSDVQRELPREQDLAQTMLQQLREKQSTLNEVESWLQSHAAEAILLTDFPDVVQLRNLRTELANMSAGQKQQSAWAKKTLATIKQRETDISDAEQRITALNQQIVNDQQTGHSLSQGKSFEQLKELFQEQQNRVKDLQELQDIATTISRLSGKKTGFSLFGGNNQVAQLPDIDKLRARVDSLTLEMQTEENIGKALEQAISNEAMIKKLEVFRKQLVTGKPCYLCGSAQHPYLSKPPVFSDAKKALADQRSKLQVLKVTLMHAEKQLTTAQQQSEHLSAKQKFIKDKQDQWTLLANRLQVASPGFSINHLEQHKLLQLEEAAELENIKNLLEAYVQTQRNIDKAKSEIAAKQAALPGLRLAKNQIDAVWAERGPEVTEQEQRYQQIVAQEKTLSAQLEQQLAKMGEKMPGKGKEDAVYDRLNGRRQDYQINSLRQTGLRDEINDLQHKLQLCQTAISEYQQQQTELLHRLQQEEALGLQLAIVEKQILIDGQTKQISEQELNLNALQTLIAQKIAEHGFTNLEELQKILTLVANEQRFKTEEQQQLQQLAKIEQQLLKLDNELKSLLADQDASVSEEDLQSLHQLLEEKIDIAEQEIRTLKNILQKQQQYRQKQQSLQTQLEKLRVKFVDAVNQVSELSSDPVSQRRKSQALLLEKLLHHANQTLAKINPRYTLQGELNSAEHGLSLNIFDRQMQSLRAAKTLSGGESFVISLCLALALADLANNGQSIESLFIDEGFGSLDADALYLAINTLEHLKLQGKTIGVISHVESVKKRIHTQIELVKNANGHSQLRLVA